MKISILEYDRFVYFVHKPYQEAAYAAFNREIYWERYGEPVKAACVSDGQDSFYQRCRQNYEHYNKEC